MSAQHTAGPWAYRPELHDDWGVVRAGRYWICQAKDPRFTAEEHLSECRANKTDPWEANARLIAAAPDLLSALQALTSAIDSCVDLTPEVLQKAERAIRSALGEGGRL